MSVENQEKIKQTAYAEAMRYMSNAKETLQKARKEDKFYADKKYVRTACGTAYNGMLLALETYLELKGVEIPKGKKHKSIDFYVSSVAQLDGKLLKELNSAYRILHIDGYYEGILNAGVIKSGFDMAYDIIDRIKPNHPLEVPPPPAKSSFLKMMYSIFL
ncbi:hypothetical protein SAMD00024442_65_7 [Candidatus Symbiothrix dinenymphae]|nr:hypothetical protein SAMD00024442_65_7 [Candidatus Symbiothrix dinenymphae]